MKAEMTNKAHTRASKHNCGWGLHETRVSVLHDFHPKPLFSVDDLYADGKCVFMHLIRVFSALQ